MFEKNKIEGLREYDAIKSLELYFELSIHVESCLKFVLNQFTMSSKVNDMC